MTGREKTEKVTKAADQLIEACMEMHVNQPGTNRAQDVFKTAIEAVKEYPFAKLVETLERYVKPKGTK